MIQEKDITNDLKVALKSGDKVRLSALRMLISEIKNKKIDERVKELDGDKIIGVINKMAKRHKESIEQFQKGGREDLVSKEKAELAVIAAYLPAQLGDEELEKIVSDSINETGATSVKDMGNVIKAVLGRVAGRADGKKVSEVVKKRLTVI